MLCPKDSTSFIAKIKSKKAPTDFDILSAMKPTEGLRWAHILCSTWMPDVLFADAVKLKMVEGIMSLPEERWATVRHSLQVTTSAAYHQTCTLCNQSGGATIACAECAVPFHSACAWLMGYRFGFELDLVSLCLYSRV